MLVFFIILSIIITITVMVYFSTIKVEIDTLEIDNLQKIKINDFNIKVYLVLFNKIKWFKISINKEKIEKIKKVKKVNLNKLIEKILNLEIFKELKNANFIQKEGIIAKALKKSKINIERLNLKAEVGLDNTIVLSYLVAILDIVLGITLARRASSIKEEKYKYVIRPIQMKKFYLSISLNSIICVRISNIIKIIIRKKSLNSPKPPIFHQRKILTKVEY